MRGMDYFTALEKAHVELPIRISVDRGAPNLFSPNRLCFCNLTIDDEEEITPQTFVRLDGFCVHVVGDLMTETIRRLTKALIKVRPKLLVVVAGDTFTSWAPDRGWA